MIWHRVDEAAGLRSGEKIATQIEGREILLCRVRDQIFAVAGRCTHAAWPLAGESLEGTEIVCSLHGARFDIRDGCPTIGPASKPLATYRVEERDGAIYVSFSR